MSTKPRVQKVKLPPIRLIFRFLQKKARVQVWLCEQINMRIEGQFAGFDEYMNLVINEAEEIYLKTGVRRKIGTIMLKGDCITLIQNANPEDNDDDE
ncbi:probable small nuclear ribonucleoprotein E [Zophobas morio]|uniref:probable small nuclear ribonucleoprotein E n=1 Tax=Zophobas morio TaxID=2755281 RepID=UPI003083B16E